MESWADRLVIVDTTSAAFHRLSTEKWRTHTEKCRKGANPKLPLGSSSI
jgi:hypothetical protein